MRILLACEESQRVTKAFREKGHKAYSCDLLPTSGNNPEWHIQGDVLPLLNDEWDMIIAFPPCTYLTVTGNRWFNVERYGEKAIRRIEQREQAVKFFMAFADCKCEKVAIENPVGVMSTRFRKPDQIIHPYMFGDYERKATCLWLKGLPVLQPTNIVEPHIYHFKNGKGSCPQWHIDTIGLSPQQRSIQRSKTYLGIANAMAEQWG